MEDYNDQLFIKKDKRIIFKDYYHTDYCCNAYYCCGAIFKLEKYFANAEKYY